MAEKFLLRWSEPKEARRHLVRESGGLRRLFVNEFWGEGVPVVLIMCAVWVFAFLAGAAVMDFWNALLMIIGFGIAIAMVQCGLYLGNSTVRISTTHVYVGFRRWRKRAIQNWDWERHQIGNDEHTVLRLQMKRSQVVRIALATQISMESVRDALTAAA